MANEGFKFTEDERKLIKEWLHELYTSHDISSAAVIGAIESLLTKRADAVLAEVAKHANRL